MGQIVECTAKEYYADMLPIDYRPPITLNQSTAKKLLQLSPWHARHSHPRLGGNVGYSSDAMETGKILHALLLEDGRGIVEVLEDDWRTKSARARRDEIVEDGKIPVLTVKLAQHKVTAAKFRQNMRAVGVSPQGQSEITIHWREICTELGSQVDCRARLDKLEVGPDFESATVWDVKTTSGQPTIDWCAKTIWEYGYDIQAAAYTAAVESVWPKMAGRVKFVFLFMELSAPYCVTPVVLSRTFLEMGKMRWHRAVDRWGWCLAHDEWPGYATEITTIQPPAWAMSKEMGIDA